MSAIDELFGTIEGGGPQEHEATRKAPTRTAAQKERWNKAKETVKRRKQRKYEEYRKDHPTFLRNPIKNIKQSAEATGHALNIAKRPFTAYLDNDAKGAMSALQEAFKDPSQLTQSLIRGYGKGVEQAAAAETHSRDELGGGGAFLAEMAGTMSPLGAPARLAKLLGGPKTGIAGALRNIAGQGALGSGEAVLAAFAEGEREMSSLGMQGTQGFFAGTAGQTLLGELLPRMAKYGLSPLENRSKAKVAERLLDTGMGDTGMTPAAIRGQYGTMVDEGAGLFDIGAGGVTAAKATERLSDAVAEAEFRSREDATGFQIDKYNQTLGHVKQRTDETIERINTRFDDTLLDQRSSWAKKKDTNEQLKDYKKIYDGLENTSDPNALGSVARNFHKTADSIGERAAKIIGKGDAAQFSSNPLYNSVVADIQPHTILPHSKKRRAKEHGDPIYGPNGEVVGKVDMATESTRVGDLMTARKNLAAKLRPGSTMNSTTINPTMIVQGKSLLKALDDEIASIVGPAQKEGAAGFATYLGRQEAEVMGGEFYNKRLIEDTEYGRSMQEYMERLKETDPQAYESAQDGFRRAMRQDIANNNATTVMNNLVGVVGKDLNPKDITKVKTQGLDMLETFIGKDDAMALVREHANDTELLRKNEFLHELLELKGYKPDAIDGIIRDSDAIIQAASLTPSQTSPWSIANISAMSRRMKALGVRDSELLTDLAGRTGPSAVDLTESMLRVAEKPSSVNIGGRTGMVTGGEGYTETVRDPQEVDEGGILEYLKRSAMPPSEQQ